jgi:hypothetical protein
VTGSVCGETDGQLQQRRGTAPNARVAGELMNIATSQPATAAAHRSALMLNGPLLATLLTLAVPNLVVMLAQAAANFMESYYVGLLGVDALAGAALVFPLVMLMQMMSSGGMGGGISSAIARALGAGRRDDAEALALHAIIVALALGLLSSLAVIFGGPLLYNVMGGRGPALDAALAYSNAVFGGAVFLWLLNALASILRGTGNMAAGRGPCLRRVDHASRLAGSNIRLRAAAIVGRPRRGTGARALLCDREHRAGNEPAQRSQWPAL